jgi:hypothetical protein
MNPTVNCDFASFNYFTFNARQNLENTYFLEDFFPPPKGYPPGFAGVTQTSEVHKPSY